MNFHFQIKKKIILKCIIFENSDDFSIYLQRIQIKFFQLQYSGLFNYGNSIWMWLYVGNFKFKYIFFMKLRVRRLIFVKYCKSLTVLIISPFTYCPSFEALKLFLSNRNKIFLCCFIVDSLRQQRLKDYKNKLIY